MVGELEYQSVLVDSVKKEGGYGFKMNHKFLSGIPDLFLSHPKQGSVLIEVKVLEPGQRTVLVSPIQAETIRRLRLAGTRCGVAAIRAGTPGVATIYMTDDHTKNILDDSFVILEKKYGELWPILEMMKICTRIDA